MAQRRHPGLKICPERKGCNAGRPSTTTHEDKFHSENSSKQLWILLTPRLHSYSWNALASAFFTLRVSVYYLYVFFFFLRFCKRSAILQPDCLRVRSPTLYSPTSLQARHRVCFSKFSFYNLFAFCNGILNLSLDTLVNSRWQACDVTLLDIIYLLLPRKFKVTKVRNCTKIIGTRKYNNLFSYESGSNDSRDRHQGILLQTTTYLSFLNSYLLHLRISVCKS